MKPMLARTMGTKFNEFPCFVQPKLNGVRALYQQGVFQSRDEKIWNNKIVEHLVQELFPTVTNHFNNLILDGELYVHGWRLQRINGAVAVNRLAPIDDTKHVEFHVFDVVDPQKPFSMRWFDVYNTLRDANLPHIKSVPTAVCTARNELDLHFHHYVKLGYEGIMLRPDGPYEFGEHFSRRNTPEPTLTTFRSKFLWKHKQWEDGEFRCIGITGGEGKADIGIGALVLETNDLIRLLPFKVGTGFTDEERVEFMKNPPIGKLVKIRYLCLTADGIPFNPSFICVM